MERQLPLSGSAVSEHELLQGMLECYQILLPLLEAEQEILLDLDMSQLLVNSDAKQASMARLALLRERLEAHLGAEAKSSHPAVSSLRDQVLSLAEIASRLSRGNQRLAATANTVVRQSLSVIVKGLSGTCLYGSNGAMLTSVAAPGTIQREA